MTLFIVLGILFTVKHFLGDFYFQSHEMSVGKRLEGSEGLEHLAKHAFVHSILTFVLVVLTGSVLGTSFLWLAMLIAFIEFLLHFTIDYCKIVIEKKNQIQFKSRQFWILLTADQGLHFLCYLGFIIWILTV